MKHLWDQIDPGCTSYPESWLRRLHQEFGGARPLSVLQRFVLAEQTLADLDHPHRYKAYFSRWCRREHEEEAALLSDAEPLLPGCDTGAAPACGPLPVAEPVPADQPGLAATRGPVPADECNLLSTDEAVPADGPHVVTTEGGAPRAGHVVGSPRASVGRAPAPSAPPPGCASRALPARGLGVSAPGAAPSRATSPLPPGDPLAGRHRVRPYPGRPRHSPFKGWSTRWPPEAYRQSIRGAYEARRARAASGRT